MPIAEQMDLPEDRPRKRPKWAGTVRNLYTSLLILLTQATGRELARIVRYLKEENRILRARLLERINVTRKERNRFLRFGRLCDFARSLIFAPRWLAASCG